MRYTFLVKYETEEFEVTVKSARNEYTAWYLIEKQFDDAISIEIL